MFQDLVIDLLKDGYKVSFNAPGHSMYPTILANESVLVEPVEPSTVHKGDIVLYRSNGSLIAHRVMGIVKADCAREFSALIEVFAPEEQLAEETAPLGSETAHCPEDEGLDASSEQCFFILRGDAVPTFDDPVKSDQILGKVVSIERNGTSLNPYSLKYKLASWLLKTTLRLKLFLAISKNL